MRLRIDGKAKGRIFIRELGETRCDFFFAALGFRCDCLCIARLCKLYRCQINCAHTHRQRIAGLCGRELGHSTDIAAGNFLDFGCLLAANRVQMANLFRGIHAMIEQRHILLDGTGNNLEVAESAVLIRSGLEHKCTRRAVRVARNLNEIVAFLANFYFALIRRRHVIADALERCNGADTGCRSAAEYRNDRALKHALTQTSNQFFIRELLACEITLHQILRQLCHALAQSGALLVNLCHHGFRNRNLLAFVALHVVRLADNTVDNADGLAVALENRDNDRNNVCAERLLQLVQRCIIIGIFFVNFRNIKRTRLALVCQTLPRLFRANARSGLARNDNQTGFTHAQCALYFAFKIKEARRIQHIDLAAAVFYRRHCGGNRELSADLLRVIVTNGISVRDLSHAVCRLGHIQHAFDQGSLAFSAVSHYTNVADFIYRIYVQRFHLLNISYPERDVPSSCS